MTEWKRPPSKGNKNNASTYEVHLKNEDRCLCDDSECKGPQHFYRGSQAGICGNVKKNGGLCAACSKVTVKTEQVIKSNATENKTRDLKIKEAPIDEEMLTQILKMSSQITTGDYDPRVLNHRDQVFLTHIFRGENVPETKTVSKYFTRLILKKDISENKSFKRLLSQVIQNIEIEYGHILMEDSDSDSGEITDFQHSNKRARSEKNILEGVCSEQDVYEEVPDTAIVVPIPTEPLSPTLVPTNFLAATYYAENTPFYCLYAVIRSIQHRIAVYPSIRDKFRAEPCYESDAGTRKESSGNVRRYATSPFLERPDSHAEVFSDLYIDGVLGYIRTRLAQLGDDTKFKKRLPAAYKQTSKNYKKFETYLRLAPLAKQYVRHFKDGRSISHDHDLYVLSYIYGMNIVLLEKQPDGTLIPTTSFLLSEDLEMSDMQDVINNWETTLTLIILRDRQACMAIDLPR